jgi:hypothetical protein
MCALLLSGALPLLAAAPAESRGKDESGGGTPEAIHLPFRGYGLTQDRKVVRIFGDDQRYTVWPFADVSSLPWGSDPDQSNIASHPWSPWSLFISLGDAAQGTSLYRLDLQTLAVTFETYIPPPGEGWTALKGLGARCASTLAGEVAFYSFREQTTTLNLRMREVTTAGVEADVAGFFGYPYYPFADNSGEWFGGPHWYVGLHLGHPPYTSRIHPSNAIVHLGLIWEVERPTGLLSYGPGAYYMSSVGTKMRLVTTGGASTILQYIQWGVPALPAPPELLDLTSPANFCKKIET